MEAGAGSAAGGGAERRGCVGLQREGMKVRECAGRAARRGATAALAARIRTGAGGRATGPPRGRVCPVSAAPHAPRARTSHPRFPGRGTGQSTRGWRGEVNRTPLALPILTWGAARGAGAGGRPTAGTGEAGDSLLCFRKRGQVVSRMGAGAAGWGLASAWPGQLGWLWAGRPGRVTGAAGRVARKERGARRRNRENPDVGGARSGVRSSPLCSLLSASPPHTHTHAPVGHRVAHGLHRQAWARAQKGGGGEGMCRAGLEGRGRGRSGE